MLVAPISEHDPRKKLTQGPTCEHESAREREAELRCTRRDAE
jgi:hypothetical protein